MKKTSIHTEPDVDVALARQAAKRGTSKAEIIREAPRMATVGSVGVKPRAHGIFSGPRDLATNVDEHLVASCFGES